AIAFGATSDSVTPSGHGRSVKSGTVGSKGSGHRNITPSTIQASDAANAAILCSSLQRALRARRTVRERRSIDRPWVSGIRRRAVCAHSQPLRSAWLNSRPLAAWRSMIALREFFKLESAGGIALVAATVVAIAVANSPLAPFYEDTFALHLSVAVGAYAIDK